jgi:hypothetical protein
MTNFDISRDYPRIVVGPIEGQPGSEGPWYSHVYNVNLADFSDFLYSARKYGVGLPLYDAGDIAYTVEIQTRAVSGGPWVSVATFDESTEAADFTLGGGTSKSAASTAAFASPEWRIKVTMPETAKEKYVESIQTVAVSNSGAALPTSNPGASFTYQEQGTMDHQDIRIQYPAVPARRHGFPVFVVYDWEGGSSVPGQEGDINDFVTDNLKSVPASVAGVSTAGGTSKVELAGVAPAVALQRGYAVVMVACTGSNTTQDDGTNLNSLDYGMLRPPASTEMTTLTNPKGLREAGQVIQWIRQNARTYDFDPEHIITYGYEFSSMACFGAAWYPDLQNSSTDPQAKYSSRPHGIIVDRPEVSFDAFQDAHSGNTAKLVPSTGGTPPTTMGGADAQMRRQCSPYDVMQNPATEGAAYTIPCAIVARPDDGTDTNTLATAMDKLDGYPVVRPTLSNALSSASSAWQGFMLRKLFNESSSGGPDKAFLAISQALTYEADFNALVDYVGSDRIDAIDASITHLENQIGSRIRTSRITNATMEVILEGRMT